GKPFGVDLQPLDDLDRLILTALQRLEDALSESTQLLEPGERPQPGNGLDSPDAGCHPSLRENHERADVSCGRHVRAAAELSAEVSHTDHPDHVAVLFAEERHSSLSDSFLGGSNPGLDGQVANDLLGHQSLDLLDLLRGDRLEMHEVESETVGGYERTGLLDV